jgi:hypothetical protein
MGLVMVLSTLVLLAGGAITSPTQAEAAVVWSEPLPGEKVMSDASSGEVIKRWTAGEWGAWKREVESANECLVRASACASDILTKRTGLIYATPGEANGGATIVADARAAGTSLSSDVAKSMDVTAEVGGTLNLGLASTALGVVALGPVAFELGIEIGNGIDQLFGLPMFGEKELEEKVATHPTCVLHKRAARIRHGEGVPDISLPEGYFAECDSREGIELKQWTVPATNPEAQFDYTFADAAGAQELKAPTVINEFPGPMLLYQEQRFAWWTNKCEVAPEPGEPCGPVGIPNVSPIPGGVQGSNEAHGYPGRPAVAAVKPLKEPKKTAVVEGPQMEAFTENAPAREFYEAHAPKTPKELNEEEKEERLKAIPLIEPGETGERYKASAEGEGFTDVHVNVLPESAIDTSKGPNAASKVSPAPGTLSKPGSLVQVDTNPADAPAPGGEAGHGGGGPTIPSLKLPKIATPCTVFPFGVPCWLLTQVSALALATEAPKFTVVTPFAGKLSIDLSVGEPVMTTLRPIIAFVAFIGIVMMLYNFSRGGGFTSGSDAEYNVGQDRAD